MGGSWGGVRGKEEGDGEERRETALEMMELEQARVLGGEWAAVVPELPARVERKIEALEGVLWKGKGGGRKGEEGEGEGRTLGSEEVAVVVESGLVIGMLLLPFAKMRELKPYWRGFGA